MTPPATAVAVLLTGPQIGEVVDIVCKLFVVAELKRLVREKLDFDMFVEVASEKDPLRTIADDLITYLNRCGRVGEFLDYASQERPRDERLRQFLARVHNTPGATSAGEQVQAFETAIGAVTTIARADPRTVGMSKVRFEVVRAELDRLARYKALHDCLHTLQLQLSAITRASRTFPAEPAAGLELKAYLDLLVRQAQRARKDTAGLLTESDEVAWVDDFDASLRSAREAVRTTSAVQLAAAVAALDRLWPEAVRINAEMIGAARRLGPGLDELARTLDALSVRPADDGVVSRLVDGAQAIHGLTPQLAGLANAHDTWQKVEAALNAAEALPDGLPTQRVPRWTQIKKLLARVCPPGTGLDPTADPVPLADQWDRATDPTTAENLFLTLHAAARHEFKDVDDRLLDLADQLTVTLGPLDTLLGVI
jgi:hypothetical protein